MSDSQTAIVNSVVVVYSVEAVGLNLGPLGSVDTYFRFCESALLTSKDIDRAAEAILSFHSAFIHCS